MGDGSYGFALETSHLMHDALVDHVHDLVGENEEHQGDRQQPKQGTFRGQLGAGFICRGVGHAGLG